MSDLICRKTMMRCNTPGTCSPHGGCRDDRDAALATKDARIAELEQKIIGLEDAFASNLDYRAMYRQLRAQLASQQQAEPLIDTSAWQSCNPGCDPEFNGEKSRHCSCEPAKAAIAEQQADPTMAKNANVAATHSEDFGEVLEVVGYTTSGMLGIAKELPLTGRIGAKCKQDERWNVPLMTVAQHSRIVAAKDAEIAELDALRNRLSDLLSQSVIAIRGPEPELTRWGYADLPQRVKTVVAELEQLRAQPARQVGGDAKPVAWRVSTNGEWQYFTSREAAQRERDEYEEYGKDDPDMEHEEAQPLYRAALAPAAVVEVDIVEVLIKAIDAEQERLSSEDDYLMDSDDCIKVIRETAARASLAPAAVDEIARVKNAAREIRDHLKKEVARLESDLEHARKKVLVVMPEKKESRQFDPAGWNSALDEVARLNRRAIPAGLLERIAVHLEWDGSPQMDTIQYAYKCDELAVELRALLGKDGE